ncbi:hypothetical protein O181_049018 [Austropuccinia psidii MF-1]|uniref:Uncharacterized protein n=1 Tax=Austropuccinia psidii MF-1 TaxID=1389203 RepID=A0A9Q3HL06_9BASI|nr:hypothetical protein [Austropuccinia psidii MF-1]
MQILPNHHYALHIPEQLMWWGPLIGVLEFPGERLIGFLQKLKTNSKSSQLGCLLTKHFCQIQRLEAQNKLNQPQKNKTRAQSQKAHISGQCYRDIWNFCRELVPDLRPYNWIPHPKGSKVLMNEIRRLRFLEKAEGRRISKKRPNNMVEYKINGQRKYGQVMEIMKLIGGIELTLIIVAKGNPVELDNSLKSIFERLGLVQVRLLSEEIIKELDIVGPVAYCKLPAWSLNQIQPTYLICQLTSAPQPTETVDDSMEIDSE